MQRPLNQVLHCLERPPLIRRQRSDHPIPSSRFRTPAAVLLLLAAGCASLPAERTSSQGSEPATAGKLVTAEQIQRTSARDAYEALRLANVPFSFRETADGQLASASRRGGAPIVVLGRVRMRGLDALRLIDARDIATIRVLNGTRATMLYGDRARFGAIVIELKTGVRR